MPHLKAPRPQRRQHALAALVTVSLFSTAGAHAMLDYPNPRGALNNWRSTYRISRRAPVDDNIHFPAGRRSSDPGTGRRYQEWAGRYNWTPFKPMQRGFRWRAGVCGDTLHGRDHLRGGKYYWPRAQAHSVARYRPGGTIDASVKMVAHHNGFIEFHLCDVSKCPRGDINAACFTRGHCIQLRRARNRECDGGWSKRCGPIDRAHPERWYLPCSRTRNDFTWERFGPGIMQFRLPWTFYCKHCVLHWFYSSANNCNPPGVLEYFRGPDRPRNWGSCPGQADARGGVASKQGLCGGRLFPEEYYNCADISVMPARHGKGAHRK